MHRIVDRVNKMDIPEKGKLMATMFPGIGFGFLPPNFDGLKERLDCEACLQICVRIKTILEKGKQQEETKRWWHSLPFFRNRIDHTLEKEADTLLKEANALRDADAAHWGTDTENEISKEFVGYYLKRESWEYTTGPGMFYATQKK